MEIYNNVSCPVCHKKFTEGDDIVTCPECGTPHHRECYSSLGHCANKNLHKENFDFEESIACESEDEQSDSSEETAKEQWSEQNSNPQPDDVNDNKAHCVSCGAEIEKGAPFCIHCGARQPEGTFGAFEGGKVFIPPMQEEYKNSSVSIDGESLEDVATVVGNNSSKFISFFTKNKKASWNWGAFIFGAYYFFFRKMYKAGSTVLAVNFTVMTAISAIFNKGYEVIYNYAASSLQNGATDMSSLSAADSAAVEQLGIAFLVGAIVIRVICAILANYIYKQKVINVIKDTKNKLKDGAQFQEMSLFGEQIKLSEKDMYRMYLSRFGGVSFMAPIVAYFAFVLLQNLINSLF